MCIHVNLKYHNHITFNQWILHLTYIYPKMKIKLQFKEVLATKNKSTIWKPRIMKSSNLTTVPSTMQNQLYNTHLVANKTYKLKE